MSGNWSNRGNGNSGSWGRGNIPQSPATMSFFISGKRMVAINAYSANNGERKAAVHFCEIGDMPEALENLGDTRVFGLQSERSFGTVEEALKAAQDWLEGKQPGGVTL